MRVSSCATRGPPWVGGTTPCIRTSSLPNIADVVQQWEHHVYWWDRNTSWSGHRGAQGIKAMLQAKGSGGWELVAVTETPRTGYSFFFKRPVEVAVPVEMEEE